MTVRHWGLVGVAVAAFATCRSAPRPTADAGESVRVVSYNIRHGRGVDDSVNLERTGRVLAALTPDIVGLQEVDAGVLRSGRADEPAVLGAALAMQHRFGSFMDYQGGRYGLAILTRFPVVASRVVNLPDGNEPRVALLVELVLPSSDTITAVNVHFDWVADDRFRFAQASRLAGVLDSLRFPYVLLGDFNDEPGSRTLGLFTARAREIAKDPARRLTFSSTSPTKEIDFVFASPPQRWRGVARAIDEPMASDHRPILAELRLVR